MKIIIGVCLFYSIILSFACVLTWQNQQKEETSIRIMYETVGIKESCMEVLQKEKYDPLNFPSGCNDNIGCYSIVYDFNRNLSDTDDHDPNNYCQGLEETYNYLLHRIK